MSPTGTETGPLETPAADVTAQPQRRVETLPDNLDVVGRAIRSDAFRDPLDYVLRSDTQQHGE